MIPSLLFLMLAFEDEKEWLTRLPKGLFVAIKTGMAVLLCMFICFCGFCFWGMSPDSDEPVDYLIVLGGGLIDGEPEPHLVTRMEKANEYLNDHPETVAILTGGYNQGDDIAVADRMYNWMVEHGGDSSRMVVENQAASTAANYENSLRLIEEAQPNMPVRIGILTNNFHIFRSMCIAEKITQDNEGYTFYAVSAPCPVLVLPHMLVREFTATVLYAVRGDLALAA